MSKQLDNTHYFSPDLRAEIPSPSGSSLRMFCCYQELNWEILVVTFFFLLFPYFFSDTLTYSYLFHSDRTSSHEIRALTGDTEIPKQNAYFITMT